MEKSWPILRYPRIIASFIHQFLEFNRRINNNIVLIYKNKSSFFFSAINQAFENVQNERTKLDRGNKLHRIMLKNSGILNASCTFLVEEQNSILNRK